MKTWCVSVLGVLGLLHTEFVSAVVKNDQVLLSKGYGLRRIGSPDIVDEKTLFAIASNSKAFTAAALSILVDEGKLQWDDRVSKHLPWFSLKVDVATRDMRVRDLLCHRSGLGTFSRFDQ